LKWKKKRGKGGKGEKHILVGARSPDNHSSTLFLLKAEITQVKGIKVCDFYSSFAMVNEYTGPQIAQV